jgi:sodium/bile acid cotransporter 7
MPCTISSGVVMVSQMNGHVALAHFLTVVSNSLGILTVPLFIKWQVASSADVKLDLVMFIRKLCLTLLLPLVIGKLIRIIRKVRDYIKPKKPITKIISIICLDVVIWVKISTASGKGQLSTLTAVSALFVISWALMLHTLFLITNAACCWVLRLDYQQKKSVILLASQKTLAVAISVITFLPESLGDTGVMVVVMALSHLSILIFDSILVAVWLH